MKHAIPVLSVVLAASVPLVISAPVHAQALAAEVTHVYSMNEAKGASVMVDSGNVRVDGSVGDEVRTGVWASGAKGYRFPWLKPNTPPAHPEHLVRIPDGPAIDPGHADYSITVRYRTRSKFGNLIQKGQARTPGGQIKIQLPKGRPSCYYKGSEGRVGIGAPAPLNDGSWHVITCTRSSSKVEFFVDGQRVGRKRGTSGYIDNNMPITIGGKPRCDQVKVTCDYFAGLIDNVMITRG